MRIRWIHFSDFHIGNDNDDAVDTRLMRSRLSKHIAEMGQKYDYVFCSGDIKEWSSDYSLAPEFMKKLCDSCQAPLERLFIVPGNHDISIGGEDRKNLIHKLTDPNEEYYQSIDGRIGDEDLALLRSGEGAFISFVEDLLGSDRAALYTKPHFVFKTEELNILHVDTTLTYTSGKDRDFVIGTKALMDALEECDLDHPTVLLTHYSFDFLSQDERNQVEMLLNDYNVQLWLAGHEHERLIRKQRDKFYECQCGNLVLQKGAEACFLTGELDLDIGEGIIRVHAWYPKKGWAAYPFARTGTEDDSFYPFVLRLPGDNRPPDASVELARAREAFRRMALSGNLFSGVNINPSILTDLECGGRIWSLNDGITPLGQLAHSLWNSQDRSSHALILGNGGMGKSTMMYYECGQLLFRRHVAVYVSLQAIEAANNESIIDHILRILYRSTDERANNRFTHMVSDAHTQPDLILFIDGFNELTGAGAQRYVAEIKRLSEYSGIQMIISSRLDFLRDFGLSHFGMIHTCDLRDEQIKELFTQEDEALKNVLAHKNLRILVKNPMMALLYANTCPIVARHKDMDYLNWSEPITNSTELLNDYYMSQPALLVERYAVVGSRLFHCLATVSRVLPMIAYKAERNNRTTLKESEFESDLREAVSEVNRTCFGEQMPENLNRINRRFRLHAESISFDLIYDLIISELCLLKSGNGTISFPHQIYRDYLAAVHLHNCLLRDNGEEKLWHREEIHKGVTEYLSHIGEETTWGEEGAVSRLLAPYRGKEAEKDDWFVQNVINCWLSVGNGERDLSSLDLRGLCLADHLKAGFTGSINIDNAWVDKETFINDKHHNKIIAIAFSHDNKTMAAISQNGIVSITNLVTQSQMIVGELGSDDDVVIGFDADDLLMVCNSSNTYKWTTIAYDIVEKGHSADEIMDISPNDRETFDKIRELELHLRESDLEGVCRKVSENGAYLAVGFESGYIQVWDVSTQDCIANLSLSDSQIATASFSKDGRFAALGSGGRLVQLWDIASEKHMKTFLFERRINKVQFPEDGKGLILQFSDGTYHSVDLRDGMVRSAKKPRANQFIPKELLSRVPDAEIIKTSPCGNAILVSNRGVAFTWDQKRKKLNLCPGHQSKVTAIAICDADERFAASYSGERYIASRNDKERRRLLSGQKLVRIRIVSTGQCQLRSPTYGRSIKKLQFFTSNRIFLSGFATNGDILLWELHNKRVHGQEHGKWEEVGIVRSSQAEPLECTVSSDKKRFISAFSNGTIVIRSINRGSDDAIIRTLPGINASVFRWTNLKCSEEMLNTLSGYK